MIAYGLVKKNVTMPSLTQSAHFNRKKLYIQNVTIPTKSVKEFLKFLKNKFLCT